MRVIRFLAAASLALTMLSAPHTAAANEMISKELAIKFANQRIPGTVVSADSRSQDGQTYYDLVIRSPDGDLYDVTINALNGQVVRVHIRDHAPQE